MINQATEVEKYIIYYAHIHKKKINTIELNYFLYYIQRFYLKTINVPLFNEDFMLIKQRPVISYIYYKYLIFYPNAIDYKVFKELSGGWNIKKCTLQEADKKIINSLLKKLFKLNLSELKKLCKTYIVTDVLRNKKIISKEFIMEH